MSDDLFAVFDEEANETTTALSNEPNAYSLGDFNKKE
jgi:hypothetical protein